MEISAEDLETFSKSLKSAEWTNNANYLQAKNIDVKMKFSLCGQIKSDINVPKNRFNDYYLNSNLKYNDYLNYIKNVEEENKRKKEENEKEKNEFLRDNFPNEKPNISNSELYKKIGEKKKEILEKDSNLYRKVDRLIPLLKTGNPKEESNQNSGIYDFTKANSGKLFTNDGNSGTPGLGF